MVVGAVNARTAEHGWVAFAAAVAAGAVPPLIYSGVLLRERRLFLRDPDEIAENRARIQRIGIPLGSLLAAFVVVASAVFGPGADVVIPAALGGAALGLSPGLVANFLRLRREGWPNGG